jgi:hypothetical protein
MSGLAPDPGRPTEPARGTDSSAPPAAPAVRIEHGDPTAEELAVLVALLAGMGGGSPEPARPASRWSAPDVRLRSAAPGGGAWRFSGMPS